MRIIFGDCSPLTIGVADDSYLTFDVRVKSSDGVVQPVTSSFSSEIGPEGGTVRFQSSDVALVVPEGALPSATTFFLKTYLDPACLPSITSEDEVSLSPSFHLSSALSQDQQFTKPLQLCLPLEVPLKAIDHDSGWKLQLMRSRSTVNGVPSGWHPVLQLNTKRCEVVFQEPFVHYDYASATVHLDQFSWFAWLGEALKSVVGSMLGFFSPVRLIDYAVFGKEIQHHKWLIAAHIIHRSRVIYESLVCKLKEKGYVELSYPNTDCIQLDGQVSLHIQCLEPWHVQQGKKDVQISTNRIWGSEQHSSCYHEVTVEDSSLSADTLECTIVASFEAEGARHASDSVELVISHPLQLKTEDEALVLSSVGIADSECKSSSIPRKEIVCGFYRWYGPNNTEQSSYGACDV